MSPPRREAGYGKGSGGGESGDDDEEKSGGASANGSVSDPAAEFEQSADSPAAEDAQQTVDELVGDLESDVPGDGGDATDDDGDTASDDLPDFNEFEVEDAEGSSDASGEGSVEDDDTSGSGPGSDFPDFEDFDTGEDEPVPETDDGVVGEQADGTPSDDFDGGDGQDATGDGDGDGGDTDDDVDDRYAERGSLLDRVDADPNDESFPRAGDKSRQNEADKRGVDGFVADSKADVPDWVVRGDPSGPENAEAAMDLDPDDTHGVDLDIGPSDPETVEAELGIHLDNIDERSSHTLNVEEEGLALEMTEKQQIEKALKERHGERAYEIAYDLIREHKSGGGAGESIQTQELLFKRALGTDAPVRVTEDGQHKIDDSKVSPEVVAAYRDLARVSRAFMERHGDYYRQTESGEFRLHRGLSSSKSLELVRQQLENPESDSYYINTSSISLHTNREETGAFWGSPVAISHDINQDNIAVLPDALRMGIMEDEIRVAGGEIEVQSDDVRVTGGRRNDDLDIKGGGLTDTILNPTGHDRSDHVSVSDTILAVTTRAKRNPDTFEGSMSEEGIARLESWVETCEEEGLMTDNEVTVARVRIEDLKEAFDA